jgi:WD40 repeat protein
MKKLEGHSNRVNSVSFDWKGLLARVSLDETVQVWDVDTGKCLKKLEGHSDWVLLLMEMDY